MINILFILIFSLISTSCSKEEFHKDVKKSTTGLLGGLVTYKTASKPIIRDGISFSEYYQNGKTGRYIGGKLYERQNIYDFTLNKGDFLRINKGVLTEISIDKKNLNSMFRGMAIQPETGLTIQKNNIPRSFWTQNDVVVNKIKRKAKSLISYDENGKLKILASPEIDNKVIRITIDLVAIGGGMDTDNRYGFVNNFVASKDLELQGVKWKKGSDIYRTIYPDGSVQLKFVHTEPGQIIEGKISKANVIFFCWDDNTKKVRFLDPRVPMLDWLGAEGGHELEYFFLCKPSPKEGLVSGKFNERDLL